MSMCIRVYILCIYVYIFMFVYRCGGPRRPIEHFGVVVFLNRTLRIVWHHIFLVVSRDTLRSNVVSGFGQNLKVEKILMVFHAGIS